jgi:hypothetical protein
MSVIRSYRSVWPSFGRIKTCCKPLLPNPLNRLCSSFGANSQCTAYIFRPCVKFGKEHQYEPIAIAQFRSKLLEQYRPFYIALKRFRSYPKLIEFMQGHCRFVRGSGFLQVTNFAVDGRVSVTSWRFQLPFIGVHVPGQALGRIGKERSINTWKNGHGPMVCRLYGSRNLWRNRISVLANKVKF